MANASYKSHHAGAQRIFDHVYDKNYITSGSRDVWKANSIALAKSAPIHIVPVYKTMFTDLPRQPRNMYVMQQNPLPHYSYYQGGDNHHQISHVKTDIVGMDRSKFFYNPLCKISTMPVPTIQIQSREHIQSPIMEQRDIACQTMYRESSAQTKPWQPRAAVKENERITHEVVYVADLIKSNHLPGEIEADIVERSRKRRYWEKTIPDVLNGRNFAKKHTSIQAFEWEQWIAREEEIDGCQKLRMRILQQMFKRREDKMKRDADTRIENFHKKQAVECEKKKAKLKNEYQRAMRKLEMKHKNISKKYGPTDIATEHIDRASDLYGPQMRFGSHPRQKHFEVFKTYFEPRLNSIAKLDEKPNIEKFVKKQEKIWEPKSELKEVIKGFWNEKFLAELYDSLLQFRKSQEISSKSMPQCLQAIPVKDDDEVVVMESKQSPSDDIDENDYQRAILLQKVIKGRAIQNIIYEGRNQCRSLIEEIRSNHEIPVVREMFGESTSQVEKNRIDIQNEQSREECLSNVTKLVREIPTQCDSAYMSFLFKFLSSELVRLKDQRKAHALYLLAEQERSKREAKEMGKRQMEDIKRQELDQKYRDMVTANSV